MNKNNIYIKINIKKNLNQNKLKIKQFDKVIIYILYYIIHNTLA